jgi:tetratricopeptide (TPR) repeat protein
MYLTHLDGEGNDSPPILIENTTAANRAVNIPEFLNIAPDGLSRIDVPAAEFYRLFDQAWTLAEKGQFDASIAVWQEALKISPDDAKAHNNLGRALAGKGDFDGAASHWERALQINPKYAEARNNLGAAALRLGRFDESIAHFAKALEISPENPEIHKNLASAFSAKGKYKDAQAQLQRAIEINPMYAEAWNDMGTVLFARGRLDDAVVQWRRVIAARPDFFLARYNLGRALSVKGQAGEAIREWERVLEANRDFAPAHFSLGDVLYRRGKVVEALAHWMEGLRRQPDNLAALRQAAWVRATCPDKSIRDGAEAVSLAERATRLPGGQQADVLDALAAAYAETGRFREAAQVARKAYGLALQEKKTALAQDLKVRITLYEADAPFRDSRWPASASR